MNNKKMSARILKQSRRKKRNENVIINTQKSPIIGNHSSAVAAENKKSARGRKSSQQKKKSLRKEILNDFKRIYGNPSALVSRPRSVKKQNSIRHKADENRSLESIIYVGTVYKFNGFTVTNNPPAPVIDLTNSASDMDQVFLSTQTSLINVTTQERCISSYSIKTLKSTNVNSCSSHTMYPSTEHLSISSDSSAHPSFIRLFKSYSADDIKMKKINKPAVLCCNNKTCTSTKTEDPNLLDIIINMEAEYKTDERLRSVDFKEDVEGNLCDSDLEDINELSLVGDLDLSLNKLTQMYDVKDVIQN